MEAMTKISFIIPTLNESTNLPRTLESIRQACTGLSYEVIVVDNQSTDSTLKVATDNNAKVLTNQGGTISKSRNMGAHAASGEVLVFIDADVSLSPDWGQKIFRVLKYADLSTMPITGSRCKTCNNGLLDQYWFSRLKSGSYINSGHLVCSHKVFSLLGGFDEKLETGEDYEFCKRASRRGMKIVPDDNLIAYHRCYPATVKAFILRESWHGRSDMSNLHAFLKSGVAMVALTYGVLTLIAIGMAIYTLSIVPILLLMFIFCITSILLTLYKFGPSDTRTLMLSSLVMLFYLTGRLLSVFYFTGNKSKRWR